MINLYARLGILPTATVDEIQQAIKREERKLSIEDLKKCQEWLLNPENAPNTRLDCMENILKY